MLPSTGYFKGLPCPFQGAGGCERPHCHYKHVRRAKPAPTPAPAPGPAPAPAEPPARHTYCPTPIAQLAQAPQRRHLPVPYTPHRPARPPRRPELQYQPGAPATRPAPYTPGPTLGAAPTAAYVPTRLADIAAHPAPPASRYEPAPRPSALRYEPTPRLDPDPNRLIELEDLASDFEILDKILDEEKLIEPRPSKSNDEQKPPSKRQEEKPKSDKRRSDKSRNDDRSKKHPEKRKHSRDSAEDKSSKRKSDDPHRKSSSVKEKTSSSRDAKDKKSSSTSKHSSSSKSSSDRNDKNSKRDSNRSSTRKSSSGGKRSSEDSKCRDRSDKSRKSEKSSKSEKESGEFELNFSVEDDVMEIYSESDEETIARECLKIFEEYEVPPVKAQSPPRDRAEKRAATSPETNIANKKRVAHSADRPLSRFPPRVALPDHKSYAVQKMTERYKAEKNKKSEAEPTSSVEPESSRRSAPISSASKVRIAHVPNVSTLLNAKKAIPKLPEPAKATVAQTVSKGVSRVSHVPNDKFCDRPGALEPLTSKVSLNLRTRYLNMMIDECLKIYLAPEDAYERALQEELATSKKCTANPIYKNSALLAISRLRKELQEANGIKKSIGDGGNVVSHSKILDGKMAEKTSWSIQNKYRKDNQFPEEFKGVKFYNNIARWVLTERELVDNGFPRPHPNCAEKGRAKIFIKNVKQKPQKGNIRTCRRCNKEYAVDKKGSAIVSEECIYHPNNKYRFRQEVKYQCCGQDETSDGCLSASCHVYEYVDHDNLRGYVKTQPKDASSTANSQVYALDCEMCYTTNGLDLTRVTVVDSTCKVIYESLVKPIFPIIDYNTRYSGLTEESMKNCKTSLPEVQATFLHMFSDKTILIGHSLESDFKALKLIHDTVVDTSILFPHKMGPPYKRALRNLSSEYLRKIIQNSVDGHDSAEDATVCMELLIWKLKEEFKLR